MTDIADNVIAIQTALTALTAQVTTLASSVAAIIPSAPVDLTGIEASLASIQAALVPTLPVPAPSSVPDSAPIAPAA